MTNLEEKNARLEEENALLKREIAYLKAVLCNFDRLAERLDEATAPPSRVAQDTAAVGGYVSGINLTETAEEILERTITHLQNKSEDGD